MLYVASGTIPTPTVSAEVIVIAVALPPSVILGSLAATSVVVAIVAVASGNVHDNISTISH